MQLLQKVTVPWVQRLLFRINVPIIFAFILESQCGEGYTPFPWPKWDSILSFHALSGLPATKTAYQSKGGFCDLWPIGRHTQCDPFCDDIVKPSGRGKFRNSCPVSTLLSLWSRLIGLFFASLLRAVLPSFWGLLKPSFQPSSFLPRMMRISPFPGSRLSCHIHSTLPYYQPEKVRS